MVVRLVRRYDNLYSMFAMWNEMQIFIRSLDRAGKLACRACLGSL